LPLEASAAHPQWNAVHTDLGFAACWKGLDRCISWPNWQYEIAYWQNSIAVLHPCMYKLIHDLSAGTAMEIDKEAAR